jgi:CRP-like cAMP-binding protein
MSTAKLAPPQNRLIARLPAVEQRRLLAGQKPIELFLGDTLADAGQRIRHLVFPIDSFISLIKPINGNRQLEVGLIGDEGVLGVSVALGVDEAPLRAMVQGAGLAWQLDAARVHRELELCPELARSLKRYIYVLLSQLAQTAACTRFHVIDARLARWLLMTRDRAGSNELRVTQEFLAFMLGVRRVGVTRAANILQRRKLIRYKRGDIEIRDGRGLEAVACECYAADKAVYRKILR